jgi:hypothetical protein
MDVGVNSAPFPVVYSVKRKIAHFVTIVLWHPFLTRDGLEFGHIKTLKHLARLQYHQIHRFTLRVKHAHMTLTQNQTPSPALKALDVHIAQTRDSVHPIHVINVI